MSGEKDIKTQKGIEYGYYNSTGPGGHQPNG